MNPLLLLALGAVAYGLLMALLLVVLGIPALVVLGMLNLGRAARDRPSDAGLPPEHAFLLLREGYQGFSQV